MSPVTMATAQLQEEHVPTQPAAKKRKLEDVLSPQPSIRDFFKAPKKQPVASTSPKNLFSYFKKNDSSCNPQDKSSNVKDNRNFSESFGKDVAKTDVKKNNSIDLGDYCSIEQNSGSCSQKNNLSISISTDCDDPSQTTKSSKDDSKDKKVTKLDCNSSLDDFQSPSSVGKAVLKEEKQRKPKKNKDGEEIKENSRQGIKCHRLGNTCTSDINVNNSDDIKSKKRKQANSTSSSNSSDSSDLDISKKGEIKSQISSNVETITVKVKRKQHVNKSEQRKVIEAPSLMCAEDGSSNDSSRQCDNSKPNDLTTCDDVQEISYADFLASQADVSEPEVSGQLENELKITESYISSARKISETSSSKPKFNNIASFFNQTPKTTAVHEKKKIDESNNLNVEITVIADVHFPHKITENLSTFTTNDTCNEKSDNLELGSVCKSPLPKGNNISISEDDSSLQIEEADDLSEAVRRTPKIFSIFQSKEARSNHSDPQNKSKKTSLFAKEKTSKKHCTNAGEHSRQSVRPDNRSEKSTKQYDKSSKQSDKPSNQSESLSELSDKASKQSEKASKQSEKASKQSAKPNKNSEKSGKLSAKSCRQSTEPVVEESLECSLISDSRDDSSVMIVDDVASETEQDNVNSKNSDSVEKRKFLNTPCSLSVPKNCSQAILPFGKPRVELVKNDRRKDSPQKEHVTRPRKKLTKKNHAFESDKPLMESTPIPKEVAKEKDMTKSSRKTKLKSASSKKRLPLNESVDRTKHLRKSPRITQAMSAQAMKQCLVETLTDDDDSHASSVLSEDDSDLTFGPRRRSLRRPFHVTLFESGEDGKSPIKMRLRKCRADTSADEPVILSSVSLKHNKKKSKVRHAQKLLSKAKTSKTKENAHREASKKSASKADMKKRVALRVSLKESLTKKNKVKTPKNMPRKSSRSRSKDKHVTSDKKTPAKLASIFNKGRSSSNDTITVDDSPEPMVEIDPEKLKQRRLFLMSGVPEIVRRQQTPASVELPGFARLSEFEPFPMISHVQQKMLPVFPYSRLALPSFKISICEDTTKLSHININASAGLKSDDICDDQETESDDIRHESATLGTTDVEHELAHEPSTDPSESSPEKATAWTKPENSSLIPTEANSDVPSDQQFLSQPSLSPTKTGEIREGIVPLDSNRSGLVNTDTATEANNNDNGLCIIESLTGTSENKNGDRGTAVMSNDQNNAVDNGMSASERFLSHPENDPNIAAPEAKNGAVQSDRCNETQPNNDNLHVDSIEMVKSIANNVDNIDMVTSTENNNNNLIQEDEAKIVDEDHTEHPCSNSVSDEQHLDVTREEDHADSSASPSRLVPDEAASVIPDTWPADTVDVWNLPKIELNLPHDKYNEMSFPVSCTARLSGLIIKMKAVQQALRISQTFNRHAPMSEVVVNMLLNEIASYNPSYPARRMYRLWKDRMSTAEPLPMLAPLKTDQEVTTMTVLSPTKVCSRKSSSDSELIVLDSLPSSPASPDSSKARRKGRKRKESTQDRKPTRRMSLRKRHTHAEEEEEEAGNKMAEMSKDKKADKDSVTVDMVEKPVVDSEAPPEQRSNIGVNDLLWTDKYQPSHSMEVIGNAGSVKRLKSWLDEWKQRTDKEARKLQKLLKKESKKQASSKAGDDISSDVWSDSDSDFEFSESGKENDYSETEDSLCNTMLIAGPHGVGKTSTVYAIATELGYQVFEVNAAMARNGKRILGQLHEATQSHQVAKDKLDKVFTTFMATAAMPTVTNSPKKSNAQVEKKTVSAAFASLFKKSASATNAQKATECGRGKSPAKNKSSKCKEKLDRQIGSCKSPAKQSGSREKGNVKQGTSPGRGRATKLKESENVLGSKSPAKHKLPGTKRKCTDEHPVSNANKSGKKRKRSTDEDTVEVNQKNKKPKKAGVKSSPQKSKLTAPITLLGDDSKSSAETSKGLSLSSKSVILFDEVDIVFEDDRGFWQAIQSFMSVSKRPIILTTSDMNLHKRFEGRFEKLIFRPPSMLRIASHLQVLCLVENIRVDFTSICHLVSVMRQDVRKCLLEIQYWAESGGGIICNNKPIMLCLKSDGFKTDSQDDSQSQSDYIVGDSSQSQADDHLTDQNALIKAELGHDEDDDDFVSIKRRVTRRRIIEDDSSTDSLPPPSPVKFISLQRCQKLGSVAEEPIDVEENAVFIDICGKTEDEGSESECTPLHELCLESLTGLTNYRCDSLEEVLKQATSSDCQHDDTDAVNITASLLSSWYQTQSTSLLLVNIPWLLPLPKTYISPDSWPVKSEMEARDRDLESQKKRFSRIQCDSFFSCMGDDEGSNNTSLDTTPKAVTDDLDETINPLWKQVGKELMQNYTEAQRKWLQTGIESLAEMYDNVSFADSYLDDPMFSAVLSKEVNSVNSDNNDLLNVTLAPGATDEMSLDVGVTLYKQKLSVASEINTLVGIRTIDKCVRALNGLISQEDWTSELQEVMSLPLLKSTDKMALSDNFSAIPCAQQRIKAAQNVMSNLPLHTWISESSRSLDYLPCLRTICFSEHLRQVAKTKRRFLHHLDGISLHLKESTLNVLCADFHS